MILHKLFLLIALWLLLIIILAWPAMIIVIPIMILLLDKLSKEFNNNFYKIVDTIKYNTIAQMRGKQKWKNNLRNGEKVVMGEAIIQCKKDTLIINGRSFLIEEIENIEFICEILRVHFHPNKSKMEPQSSMTVEEYYNVLKQKNVKHETKGFDLLSFKKGIYYFEKEYYILITLYNAQQESCVIGRDIDRNDTQDIPKVGKKMFLELQKHINSLKIKT